MELKDQYIFVLEIKKIKNYYGLYLWFAAELLGELGDITRFDNHFFGLGIFELWFWVEGFYSLTEICYY